MLGSEVESRSSIFSETSDYEEGVSFYDYVVKTCGPNAVNNFSNNVDLESIRLICLLGEGSFAKVFLVKK